MQFLTRRSISVWDYLTGLRNHLPIIIAWRHWHQVYPGVTRARLITCTCGLLAPQSRIRKMDDYRPVARLTHWAHVALTLGWGRPWKNPPSLVGFEPTTSRSVAQSSNHWAMGAGKSLKSHCVLKGNSEQIAKIVQMSIPGHVQCWHNLRVNHKHCTFTCKVLLFIYSMFLYSRSVRWCFCAFYVLRTLWSVATFWEKENILSESDIPVLVAYKKFWLFCSH